MIAGTLEIQLMANMARLASDMDKAKRTVSGAVDKINNILGAIGVGISVDFLAGLVAKSNEYSKSIAALSTQISGATGQIKELDAASRKLSVQFGTTAVRQSAGFYDILSAGITDTAKATALLTEANRLAIGGNADLMVAVDGLTSIIKGYGEAAGTASEIADTFFTASLAGKLSIQELSDNIGKVVPLATAMQVSVEEVTAAMAALTLGGVSAKESVTGIRAILASVAKPSAEAARLAEQIGLQFNSAGVQAMGFAKFLEEVKQKTKGSADQMAILFGGVESLVPALALTGNAGVEFNNILAQMASKAGATEEAFDKMANSPGFKWDRFMSTMSGIAISLGDALANVLTPAAEMAAKALNKLFGFNDATGIEKQVQLINKLNSEVESMANRRHIPIVGGLLFDKKQFDLLEHQLEMAKADLESMQKADKMASVAKQNLTVEVDKNTAELIKNNDVVLKSKKLSEDKSKAFDIEVYKLKEYQNEAARARQITDSVATKQERYNKTLEELERLKPYLTVETYNRALEKAQGELDKTAVQTRNATDEVSQMWIQAGRNIQSALGNLVFDFFSGGLDNMVKNAGNAVLRIMSEFAGLRIAQSIGLASLFTAGTAAASTGAAAGGGLLNIASLGTSAFNLFKVGGGISQGVASLFGVGGTQAAAQAGAMALWGSSGAATGGLSGMASGLAGMAGPAMALFAVDAIGRMLAGDKKLGGFEMVPVLGGFLAALFGRGPLKFKEQTLLGNVSTEGFSGALVDRYKASGGLIRGSKTDNIIIDTQTGQLLNRFGPFAESGIAGKLMPVANQRSKDAMEIGKILSESFSEVADALFKTGENLGISTDGLKGFNTELKLVSEKGKTITEEQISKEIERITDEMARGLLPTVDQFSKRGETALNTLQRLSKEFSVLTDATQLLFNKTAEQSKAFINQFGFSDRTAFLDKAGGADAFAAMVSGFAQNFLTEDQRMRPVIESLVSQRNALGLSNINTRQQVTDAVQSGRLNSDQLLFLLKNQDAINQVFVYLDKFNSAVGDTAAVVAQATRELNIRNADETDYGRRLNESIQKTTQSISELENIASQLNETVNDINPLSVEQARRIVSSGNLSDPNLQSALGVLRSMSGEGFGSALDFARAKALNTDAVTSLRGSVSNQIGLRNRELEMLMNEKSFFQEALARAATMYQASLPQYSSGTDYVPSTGPKMLHKGERVINASQNGDIVKTLKEIAASSAKLTDLIDRLSGGGGALLVENV